MSLNVIGKSDIMYNREFHEKSGTSFLYAPVFPLTGAFFIQTLCYSQVERQLTLTP